MLASFPFSQVFGTFVCVGGRLHKLILACVRDIEVRMVVHHLLVVVVMVLLLWHIGRLDHHQVAGVLGGTVIVNLLGISVHSLVTKGLEGHFVRP